jgi:hypothetical protein
VWQIVFTNVPPSPVQRLRIHVLNIYLTNAVLLFVYASTFLFSVEQTSPSFSTMPFPYSHDNYQHHGPRTSMVDTVRKLPT